MLRRTPLKPGSGFTAERVSAQRQCSVCEGAFFPHPLRPMATVCSPKCAGKVAKRARLTEAKQTRQRREALQTIPDLIKIAQREFNAFIRERDKDKPCICCGASLNAVGGQSTGGAFDCGHYRSVGSASHLRFDERNAHGQRKVCNRYGAGRAVDYRIGLISRIGAPEVEALEADNVPRKWTREELREIAIKYRSARKALEKEQG